MIACDVLFIMFAFLIGSIPFGRIISRRVAGMDLQAHGSGNIGAANVGRVAGMRWGLLSLTADWVKGPSP